ncbi:MAG: methionine--tRNA ligase [Chitinivibrionales bacterium]|nr:methionine--tRNA ligase [Chitinivibrionales bacterium]
MAPSKNSTPEPLRPLLVTSALPYANADIHLGHLLEAVQTDIFVRFQKLLGRAVTYVCADDTHGTPIQLAAIRRGITPEALIAQAYENHTRDYAAFNIGFDIFYTTNSPENRFYAETIYEGLKRNGLIVTREIEQFFCETDRRFLPDRFIVGVCPRCGAADQYGDVCEVCKSTYEPTELKQARCITCGKTPVTRKSTHAFVTLNKCEAFLRQYLTGDVLQEDMRNFIDTWIKDGLHQWCITRDAPYFGFAVPDMPGKYFYVWLDAPIGYLSSSARWCKDQGKNIADYWDENASAEIVHFIGKDIVYFHTLFWPVMLHNAGFKLPSRIFVHGFLNMSGEKMSKTRGTFILARDFAERVAHPQAAEYLRFFFAAKLGATSADMELDPHEFVNRVNAVLANIIGNLHHRTAIFIERSFNGAVPDAAWDASLAATAQEYGKKIEQLYKNVEYKSVVELVQALGTMGNKYFQDKKPWESVKTNPDEAAAVMVTCINIVKACAVFLKPITPNLAAALERQVGFTFAWNDFAFSLRNCKLGPTEKLATPIDIAAFAGIMGPPPADTKALEPPLAPEIDISEFGKTDLRVATIVAAERVKKSDKLLKLQVDLGAEKRQVVAGIGKFYEPEKLIGKQVVIVANLKPAKLMGETSQGMVLAAKDGDKLVLLSSEVLVANGSKIS